MSCCKSGWNRTYKTPPWRDHLVIPRHWTPYMYNTSTTDYIFLIFKSKIFKKWRFIFWVFLLAEQLCAASNKPFPVIIFSSYVLNKLAKVNKIEIFQWKSAMNSKSILHTPDYAIRRSQSVTVVINQFGKYC